MIFVYQYLRMAAKVYSETATEFWLHTEEIARNASEVIRTQLLWICNNNWTEWSAIWSEIIRVISNRMSAQREFDLKSQAWFQTKNCTTQSPFTTLLHLFWNHRVLLSILHSIFLTLFPFWCAKERMRFRQKKWYNLGINRAIDSQSDCKDHQWFQNGCNKFFYAFVHNLFNVYYANYNYLIALKIKYTTTRR